MSDLRERAAAERAGLVRGDMAALEADTTFGPEPFEHGIRGAWVRFSQNRLAVVGWILLGFMVMLAIFVPIMAPEDALDKSFTVEGPSAEHWLGTDRLGRDMWTVLWLGARTSLSVALAVAAIIFLVGTVYGAISGYFGRWIDNLMMRFLDSLYGLPYLPIAIIMVVFIRETFPETPALVGVVLALSVTAWFTAARLMRGEVLRLKHQEYVESARGTGASVGRIIFRHLIPNAIGVLIVAAFLEIPAAIIGEATLSFLGLGIPVGEPSWGSLANQGYKAYRTDPHLIAVPGTVIAIAVWSAVVFADGVRDVLDPRARR